MVLATDFQGVVAGSQMREQQVMGPQVGKNERVADQGRR